MMTFLDLVRKGAKERKQRDLIMKGGKGSGWYAPPKGTHTEGAKAKGDKDKQLVASMSDQTLRRAVREALKQYDAARQEKRWNDVGQLEPRLKELTEEERLRHFAKKGWKPKGMKVREWRSWKQARGL